MAVRGDCGARERSALHSAGMPCLGKKYHSFGIKLPYEFPEVAKFFGKGRKAFEMEGIRAIGEGASGVIVHFHKNSIDPGRHSRACQGFNELRLPTTITAFTTGKLQRVRNVENHRVAKSLHHCETPHINY